MHTTLFVLSVIAAGTAPQPSTVPAGMQGTQRAPLTLKQVQDLLAIAAPDVVIAEEISARGASFQIDEGTLNELRSRGAGQKTLSVLQKLQSWGDVIIVARHDVLHVYVDGLLAGRTDGIGPLRLRIAAGEHEFVLKRDRDGLQATLKRSVEGNRETRLETASEVPVRPGSGIATPTKLRDARPTYPSDARTSRIQGSVVLDLVLNTDGTVRDVKVIVSNPALDSAAIEAAKQWAYSSTFVDGVRVPIAITETVQFTLESSVADAGPAAASVNRPSSAGPKDPVSAANTVTTGEVNKPGYPMSFPVVHAHKWGRCWGTLVISTTSLRYEQAGDGKDSFEVPLAQIASVGSWSPSYLEIVLSGGQRLHFAHGVMRDKPGSGFTIADLVNLSPKEPVIAAILGAK